MYIQYQYKWTYLNKDVFRGIRFDSKAEAEEYLSDYLVEYSKELIKDHSYTTQECVGMESDYYLDTIPDLFDKPERDEEGR